MLQSWKIFLFFLILLNGCIDRVLSETPVLYFSDLSSGPKSGNSDTSLGQTAGDHGAIVTIWGRGLEDTRVYCNGQEAAYYYFRGNAMQPADLFTFHKMHMISFQVHQMAQDGAGEIYVMVNGQKSNSLPFTIREGAVLFVKTNGDDDNGDGSWNHPWRTIPKAANSISPGDIAYVCDGVDQITESDASAAVNLNTNGIKSKPKALIVYPGAVSRVGNKTIERAFYLYNWENDAFSPYWVIAKFTITTGQVGAPAYTGYRVIGNSITAPNGDGMDGAINAEGNDVTILGNELENVGSSNCSKLYHAIYGKGYRKDDPPRAPKESNREIAWNYIHDCKANRAINVYSEQVNSAFIDKHSIHDNVIVDQRGDGIMLGYYVIGDNWIFNNLIIRAGLGPEWPDGESYHTGIRINTGHEEIAQTVVYCYNNTLYGCGWSGAVLEGENGHVLISPEALALNSKVLFSNNIIFSTGQPYIAEESAAHAIADHRNSWFGVGNAPSWDTGAVNAAPAFIQPSTNNFQLGQGSPCINTGIDASLVVQKDLLGISRPQGTGFDLGAFEFSEAGTAVESRDRSTVLHKYQLLQNHPNPFNPETVITFTLSDQAHVSLEIYNMLGEYVRSLADGLRSAGAHSVPWDGRNQDGNAVASGIYLYRLYVDDNVSFSIVRKLVLSR